MYVSGLASTSFGADRTRAAPSATSATARLCRPNFAPTRAGQQVGHHEARRCAGCPAYSRPGLPRPTTSHGAVSSVTPVLPTPSRRLRYADRRPRTSGTPAARATDQASVAPRRSRPRRRSLGSASAASRLGLGLVGGLDLGGVALELLGGRRRGDRRDGQVRVGGQLDALRQLDVAGGDLGAGLQALDRDLEAVRQVQRLGGDRRGVSCSCTTRVPVAASPISVHRDVDGDLLAALDDDQVDVLEGVLDRVTLDRLRQRERLRCRRRCRW